MQGFQTDEAAGERWARPWRDPDGSAEALGEGEQPELDGSQGSPDQRPEEPEDTFIRVHLEDLDDAEGAEEVNVVGRIRVARELFEIRFSDGLVLLTHPVWSLEGSGQDLRAAEANLMEEARDLALCLLDVPASELDSHATEMQRFCMQFVALSA